MTIHFFDNTDPDGIARTLARLAGKLDETLVLVMSKSGGTPETRNGMLEAAAAYEGAGLDFAQHAVAVTMAGSKLDKTAERESWLARFPMWDWVGGRTSELSAVGLLPAALQGLDIDAMLAGAAAMDEVTRSHDTRRNPAALLALMWYPPPAAGEEGHGGPALQGSPAALLPLSAAAGHGVARQAAGPGRQARRPGHPVYGNKGSTDQHAYVQQLRDGVNNFFVTFIGVLGVGGTAVEVEPASPPATILHGFLLGTRARCPRTTASRSRSPCRASTPAASAC